MTRMYPIDESLTFRHSAPRSSPVAAALPSRPKEPEQGAAPKFHAIIDYQDEYVQPMLLAAMKDLFPEGSWAALHAAPPTDGEPLALSKVLPNPSAKLLQITPYEIIDFEYASDHGSSVFVNSYMIRKALIRKHYLSATVEGWVAKHPESALARGVKRSEHFEVDYAEFLDDSLVEAFDLRESMDRNVDVDAEGAEKAAADREWWILKPGMSDRGQGIRLFSTMEELQDVFDAWEEERPDSDDEDEDEGGANDNEGGKGGDYITTSHLRHFVAQPYIHPPLLLPGDGRKFHLRTYVLAVGCLDVYVFSDMLALFAAKPYLPPWETEDLDAHLTNTCLQQEPGSGGKPPVRRLRDLGLANEGDITAQIRALTGDLFEAAARGMTVHFQPQPNGFEAYGLDFLVGADGTAWLLEVNAFPDFRQSGEGEKGELRGVVDGFWREALRVAVGGFFGVEARDEGRGEGRLELVREVDLGRR
jgi:tubulin---tyrosine ligase